jgi:hypothetical protein
MPSVSANAAAAAEYFRRDARIMLEDEFQQNALELDRDLGELFMRDVANHDIDHIPITGAIGRMKKVEAGAQPHVHSFVTRRQTVENEEYEGVMFLERKELEDLETGATGALSRAMNKVNGLAQAARNVPWFKIVELLTDTGDMAGKTCFDGEVLFSSSHIGGVDNTIDDAAHVNNDHAALFDELIKVVTRFGGFKDPDGKDLITHQAPRALTVIVPLSLWIPYREVFTQAWTVGRANSKADLSSSNAMVGAGVVNVAQRDFDIRVMALPELDRLIATSELAATKAYWINRSNAARKPMVLLEKRAPDFDFLGRGSEHWINTRTAKGVASTRFGVAPYLYDTVIEVDKA